MKYCPVCQSDNVHSFLHRSHVTVHQNLVVATPDAARNVTRGGLELVSCRTCGFVWNLAFDPALLEYGENYDNTQSCSPFFDDYMSRLVRHMVEERGVRDKVVVEVGCGKGHFLHKLVTYPGAWNRGFGFDPSYIGPDSDCNGRLRFHRRFYGPDCAEFRADVIVCRHVIEHVPDPVALLKSIRGALISSPDTRVFFETPCVDWILENEIIWDFFYEHCSLFSLGSLRTAFELAGFSVVSVQNEFGGQYLWLEAVPAEIQPSVSCHPGKTPDMAMAYGVLESGWRARWCERLNALREEGAVSLWGGGGKGATFANLIDPDCFFIDSVVDLNPNKQGKFLPGTGHPIIDYRALPQRGVRNAILMNPNYRDENLRLLSGAGITINLIDWS